MEESKILEILNSSNRYWSSGKIEAGFPRETLARCVRELDRKEVLLLQGVRRSGKSTLMAQMIRTLLEKNLIRIVGRKEIPGRPILYGTTQRFLELFELKNLSFLPSLEEIKALHADLSENETD